MTKPTPTLTVRKPGAAKTAEDFLAEGDAPPSQAEDSGGGDANNEEITVRFKKKPKAPFPRGTIVRADGHLDARLSVYMDRELALRIRAYCLDTGSSMSDFAKEVLEKAARKLPGK
jgi:hypothetical protein